MKLLFRDKQASHTVAYALCLPIVQMNNRELHPNSYQICHLDIGEKAVANCLTDAWKSSSKSVKWTITDTNHHLNYGKVHTNKFTSPGDIPSKFEVNSRFFTCLVSGISLALSLLWTFTYCSFSPHINEHIREKKILHLITRLHRQILIQHMFEALSINTADTLPQTFL